MAVCPESHQKTFIERSVKTRYGRAFKRRRLYRDKDFHHQERQSGREPAVIRLQQDIHIQFPGQKMVRKHCLPLYRDQS